MSKQGKNLIWTREGKSHTYDASSYNKELYPAFAIHDNGEFRIYDVVFGDLQC